MFESVDIKEVQEYWDSRPCNIEHSQAPVGTREYFDQVEKRKYFVEPHIPKFAEFPKWQGKKVLEIGCGIGTDTINFARNGAYVTAVDLSDKSLDMARNRSKVYGLTSKIRFSHGNAEELTSFVHVEPYDLVYSFGVIHHTPNPSKVISELKHYMNFDSELRIMLYSRVSYKLFWVMKREDVWDFSQTDKLIGKYSEAQTGCPVTYTYSFDEVYELLGGFDILDIKKAHIFKWDIEAYKNHEYKKDAAWVRVPDERIAQLEKELGWHTLIKAKLCQLGE